MAIGVPCRLRPGVVTREMVMGNVHGYQRHIAQHRDGMRLVAVEECHTEEVGRTS